MSAQLCSAVRQRYGEDDEALHAIAVGGAAWRNRPHGGSGNRGDTRRHVGNKIDEVIFGHLTELNGKFKLRATELTFAPDGYVGVHHHVGPGIRYVISGELTFAEGGQETVYKAGEYYFETGNLAHTAQNKTNLPLRVLVVEVLPKDWTAPAMIAPKSQ